MPASIFWNSRGRNRLGPRRSAMRRLRIALAMPLIAVASVLAPASAQDVLKLAIVAEITGGGAPSGTMWRDGVILAVEDINKTGGMLGKRVETFVMDTQTYPPTSVAVMRRAINERPIAIM